MGKISFNDAVASVQQTSSDYPTYFSLKNDGDEAIVRILHDSVDSFDIVMQHNVGQGKSYRSVNCIRNMTDPLEKCPLCASGNKPVATMYIHLIEYTTNEKGEVVPSQKVWSRGMSYATKLRDMINEYGPLSQCIFKIRRSGVAGSKDTTYSMMFANPNIYSPDRYPLIDGAFNGWSAVGNSVMDKSYDELCEYLKTGSFPENKKKSDSSTAAAVNSVNTSTATTYSSQTTYAPVNQQVYPQPAQARPWDTPEPSGEFNPQTMQRPVRYM